MKSTSFVFAAVSSLVLVACSSSSSGAPPTDAAGGSGTAGAGTAGAGNGGTSALDGTSATGGSGTGGATTAGAGGGGGAACGMIANVATTIADTYMPSASVPVGTGGPIADGTYVMTGHIGYMGASMANKMHTFTFRITGSVVDLTGHDNADPDQSVTLGATTTPTGSFDWSTTCPIVGKKIGAFDSYTATATELHLFEGTKKQEVILTKK